jgi:flagellar protein FlaG
MSNITQMTTVPADLVGAQAAPPAPPAATPPKPPAASGSDPASESEAEKSGNDSQQRLVISEGAETGVYVYTILDRATGQVLVQIPREEVVRIAARPDYTAGQVIDTKV